jgi:hypothetical protein
MNNETCIHGGIAPKNLLENLHQSQGGSGRHRCPICAFEEGFLLGSSSKWQNYDEYCLSVATSERCTQGSLVPPGILRNLGENQGGTGRHKCTNCAFKQGFDVAVLKSKIDEIKLELVKTPSLDLIQKKRNFNPLRNSDFIEQEVQNKRLGLLGELFIIQTEKKEPSQH